MLNDFKEWMKTKEGISTFDAITYGWILGIITTIITLKSGLL